MTREDELMTTFWDSNILAVKEFVRPELIDSTTDEETEESWRV